MLYRASLPAQPGGYFRSPPNPPPPADQPLHQLSLVSPPVHPCLNSPNALRPSLGAQLAYQQWKAQNLNHWCCSHTLRPDWGCAQPCTIPARWVSQIPACLWHPHTPRLHSGCATCRPSWPGKYSDLHLSSHLWGLPQWVQLGYWPRQNQPGITFTCFLGHHWIGITSDPLIQNTEELKDWPANTLYLKWNQLSLGNSENRTEAPCNRGRLESSIRYTAYERSPHVQPGHSRKNINPVKGQDNISPLLHSTSPIEIFSIENYLDKV